MQIRSLLSIAREILPDEAALEQIRETMDEVAVHYSRRFAVMGAVALSLLLVVGYLYYVKVGAPVEQLEGATGYDVITHTAPISAIREMPEE